ncbi:MAG TPA: iron export ABC transporter permease subunit FetB [Phycisphaerae bacterium]|nr:iron export ABC transporter permease subunit FetB [Phycisphaerae bacterium]
MSQTANVIPLNGWELLMATALVVAAGGISLLLRLGIERRLSVAAVRTVVQLLLIGYVLRWVFALNHPGLIAAVIAVMLLAASREGVRRPSRSFRGATGFALTTLTASALTITFIVTRLVIDVQPTWHEPRYLIPLLGMVLGNQLTGVSLCTDKLLSILAERRHEIEMELACGATRWEAAREALRESVRTGMIPNINSMMVTGLVFLPGMMTGQILAGIDPVVAVRYQIMVMFMIAAATSLGCILMTLLTYRRMFNARHQLESDRIRSQKS